MNVRFSEALFLWQRFVVAQPIRPEIDDGYFQIIFARGGRAGNVNVRRFGPNAPQVVSIKPHGGE